MEQGAEDVPVVYLHEIKREYRQGEATLTILNGAKLALWAGQSVALVAPSGSGKSTLMNALVGARLSIVTSNAQTTRHRILGILNGEDFQLVYSDTPGIIQPKYELHNAMMSFVYSSLEDADVILFVTDIYEKHDEEPVVERLRAEHAEARQDIAASRAEDRCHRIGQHDAVRRQAVTSFSAGA